MPLPGNVFDDIAPIYDDILPSHVNRHYLDKRKSFILHYLKQNDRMLDVGCGTGRLITELSSNNEIKVSGCDSSFEMIKNIESRTRRGVICCNSDYLAYRPEAFDIVVSIAVFHHLSCEDVVFKTLREIARVTKKGGKIIIWDANSLNPYWFLLFKRVPHDRNVKRIVPLKKIILEARKLDLVNNMEVFKSGWVPDFAPQKMLPFFKFFERILERLPLVNYFCAHNIIIFTK